AGQQYMMEQMLPDLRKNDFESAFKTYANLCEKFMKQAAEGSPYDTGNLPKEPLEAWHYLLAIAIGLLGGGIVTGVLTKELHSVRMQGQADFYMKSPIRVSRNNVIHLYDTVTKVRKPDPPKSGGGSSIHSGSSGRSHGGSHGKF
ncbi:MAG: TPM domain-containing protein, partial [Eubacteriales bacterium]|nr:TPM domain-containing protein [Eubacteriales bacterium]